jgi:hypothetical protein
MFFLLTIGSAKRSIDAFIEAILMVFCWLLMWKEHSP